MARYYGKAFVKLLGFAGHQVGVACYGNRLSRAFCCTHLVRAVKSIPSMRSSGNRREW